MPRDLKNIHAIRRRAPYLNTLVCALVVLNLLLIVTVTPGCKTSESSGSTVTGRSTVFPGDFPMPFVRVLADGTDGRNFKVTDSTGTYTMLDMPLGTYTITFARFGKVLYETNLVISEPGQSYIVDLPVVEPGIAKLDGSCSSTSDGSIVGADVWVLFEDGPVAHAVSGAGGLFSFTNLPDSRATVIATADGFENWMNENLKIGFEGVRNLLIEMTPVPDVDGGRISGFIRNESGEIIEDAFIGVLESGSNPGILVETVDEVLSTANGYEITDIPPETYVVVCIKSGYSAASELVIVEAGQEYTVNFTLEEE